MDLISIYVCSQRQRDRILDQCRQFIVFLAWTCGVSRMSSNQGSSSADVIERPNGPALDVLNRVGILQINDVLLDQPVFHAVHVHPSEVVISDAIITTNSCAWRIVHVTHEVFPHDQLWKNVRWHVFET